MISYYDSWFYISSMNSYCISWVMAYARPIAHESAFHALRCVASLCFRKQLLHIFLWHFIWAVRIYIAYSWYSPTVMHADIFMKALADGPMHGCAQCLGCGVDLQFTSILRREMWQYHHLCRLFQVLVWTEIYKTEDASAHLQTTSTSWIDAPKADKPRNPCLGTPQQTPPAAAS